ncbi:MAG: hypothetical protein QF619_12700 [Candidatus Binatia bacterium]|nr:hypothetical protein [Candidatus Binatia bacterium]
MQGESLSVPLSDLKLRDIGKEKDCASPGEVAEIILGAMNRNIGAAVTRLNPDGVVDALKEGISGPKSAIGRV